MFAFYVYRSRYKADNYAMILRMWNAAPGELRFRVVGIAGIVSYRLSVIQIFAIYSTRALLDAQSDG